MTHQCIHLTREGTRCRRNATQDHMCTQHRQMQTVGGAYIHHAWIHRRRHYSRPEPEPEPDPQTVAKMQLLSAGENGNRQKAEKLLEKGVDSNQLLFGATIGGHNNLVLLAKEHGADGFEKMLRLAIENDHLDLAELAISWGAKNISVFATLAANLGKTDFIRLFVRMRKVEPNSFLSYAAQKGMKWLAELSKELGADNFNEMAQLAKKEGHKDLCKLAKTWGATEPKKCGFFS